MKKRKPKMDDLDHFEGEEEYDYGNPLDKFPWILAVFVSFLMIFFKVIGSRGKNKKIKEIEKKEDEEE